MDHHRQKMFSSQLLANSDFYTGAFTAELGDASAGVFDMKLRNGNNQKHAYAFFNYFQLTMA